MLDIFRFSEIAEAGEGVLNPLAEAKLDLLGEVLQLRSGTRVIDLGSGKGEMLCRYATRHGISGTGVDIYPPFVERARARANELGVSQAVTFHCGNGTDHVDQPSTYDVGMAIGTTWIGGGLLGTIDLLRTWTKPQALLAIGEVFWVDEPPPEVREIHDPRGEFGDLVGILDRVEGHGLDLVEMLIASDDDWDRYQAGMWPNIIEWLDANPNDPIAEELRIRWKRNQRAYMLGARRCMGWGVFVLRPRT